MINTLPLVTLTGASPPFDPEDFWELSERYSVAGDPRQVEWGILYSEKQQGVGRYPSLDWIEGLTKKIAESQIGPSFALHVCGSSAVSDLIAGKGRVSLLAKEFNRIQINFHAARFPLEEIRSCFLRFPEKIMITQYNKANHDFWTQVNDIPNHSILFDQSGGRGKSPEAWPVPLGGVSCGYAGGLGVDNLSEELARIQAVTGQKPFWVDMESKLRNGDDHFDREQAIQCLKLVRDFWRGVPAA